jgi:hypothetical protein
MPAKLALKSRKNLRDHEATRDANIAKIVAAVEKKDIVYEMDDVAIDEACAAKNYVNRIGQVCYEWRLTELANNIVKACADDMVKTAIQQAWTGNKILFTLDPSLGSGYQFTKFVDGNLVMTCKPEHIASNVGLIGQDIAAAASNVSAEALPLASRKNLRDNEAKRDAHLAKIAAALDKKDGVVYEMDDVAVDTALNAKNYTNRIGEVTQARLEILANKIAALCEDEMTKEALQEAWTGNKIILDISDDSLSGGYHFTKFADGNLVMMCKSDKLYTNVGEIGNDIENAL